MPDHPRNQMIRVSNKHDDVLLSHVEYAIINAVKNVSLHLYGGSIRDLAQSYSPKRIIYPK